MPITYINPYIHAGGANWWEAGGATGAVAVWQAVGAATKAASLLDLSGNGVNLTEVGTVTWSTSAGWSGFGLTTPALTFSNPVTGTGSRTLIARVNAFSVGNNNIVALNQSTTNYAGYGLTVEAAVRIYNGFVVFNGGATNDIVIAVTAPAAQTTNDILCYIDGVSEGIDSVSDQAYNTAAGTGIIGAKGSTANNPFFGDILAIAIYSTQLSSGVVAAVSTAMAAL